MMMIEGSAAQGQSQLVREMPSPPALISPDTIDLYQDYTSHIMLVNIGFFACPISPGSTVQGESW